MVKGIIIGFVITMAFAAIPLVHFVTIWPGPFVGGFIGGSRARATASTGIAMGFSMGLLMVVPAMAIGWTLSLFNIVNGLSTIMLVAGGISIYTALLGSLGAMIGGETTRRQA